MRVEETIFETPSGNVRGIVIACLDLKGKWREKRIAHATLLTDRAPDITLDIPKKVELPEVVAIAAALNEFADRVQRLA